MAVWRPFLWILLPSAIFAISLNGKRASVHMQDTPNASHSFLQIRSETRRVKAAVATKLRRADSSDFSLHQFLTEDTPDTQYYFLQMSSKTRRVKAAVATQLGQDPESPHEYEYGDMERAVSQRDLSDVSLHQFLTEDTPENSDSFLQTGKGTHRTIVATNAKLRQTPADLSDAFGYGDGEMTANQGESSDFSPHWFLTDDDGRGGISTNGDDSGEVETARSRALAADDISTVRTVASVEAAERVDPTGILKNRVKPARPQLVY